MMRGKKLFLFFVIFALLAVLAAGAVFASRSQPVSEDTPENTTVILPVTEKETDTPVTGEEPDAGEKLSGPAEEESATLPTEAEPEESVTAENVHRYEVIAADLSWSEAYAACVQAGGYLATVTSEEEWTEIVQLAEESGLRYLWLGGCLGSDEARWGDDGCWITGERWSWDRWYAGEPSYTDQDGISEPCLCLWRTDLKTGWTMNDQRNGLAAAFPDLSGSVGYVCEWDSESQVPDAPPELNWAEPAAAVQPSETAVSFEEEAQRILNTLSLRERVYQMFIVTPEELTGISGKATRSGDTTRKALEAYPVGGIVYFADNLKTREQCIQMISDAQSYSRLGLFIAVDEEGGTVSRVGRNPSMGVTSFPPMGEIGSTGDSSQAYEVGYTIGSELSELGFNLDFAPVADVNSNPNNPVIGMRAFSCDPEQAAEMVAAAVTGFSDSGILCTLKHFPGHGDTATDSHEGYAETTKTLEELESVEFLPFRAGIEAGAQCVMVGHISAPQITGDTLPASLSKPLIDLLKEELGFDGLIISDSMSMDAIAESYTPAEAAVKAVTAGVDMILMPADLEEAAQGILDAIDNGTLKEADINASVLNILERKLQCGIISSSP